jgi:replicative DNA helicase
MNTPDPQFDDVARGIPQSIEAEQWVLGALLIDNDAIDRIGDLKAEHFYRYDHRLIFESISRLVLAAKAADVLTVFESLTSMGHADRFGGLSYLNALAQNTLGSASIRRYTEIVIDHWRLRGIIAAADRAAALVFERKGRQVSELVSEAQAMFEPLAETSSREPQFAYQELTPIVEEIDRQYHGGGSSAISTGFKDLDAKLDGGVNDGELVIVAGRPSMGKTAFAMNIGEHVTAAGGTVLVFSMEMPAKQLVQRALATTGSLALSKVRNGAKLVDGDWPKLTHAVQVMSELPLLIDDSPGLSLMEIVTRSRAVKRRHGLKMVIIDYIGLMTGGDGDSRTQQVGSYSRGLKGLAKQLGVPVIALAQLNRAVDGRPNKRPAMSDLRDSGEIEQDADTILFLYRDEVYHPDSQDRGTAEVIIAKQRNGEIGATRLAFIGEHSKFADLAPGYVPVPRTKPKQQRGFEE